MDIQEIQETPVWALYEKGRNYHRRVGIYADTDRNYNFYNGNQWAGARLGDVEPVQKNFIKSIVKYKLAVIHDNLYAVHYSSGSGQPEAERYCAMLNRYAARIWEKDDMDFKGRRVTKDAAINDEGIVYVDFDPESGLPVNEVLKKNDVYYGNENDDDIQSQPYILIRRRLPVVKARELAEKEGVETEKLAFLIGDNDTFEESGQAAKTELDPMVTLVYKLYKEGGTVRYACATRWLEIIPDRDLGIRLYPLAHMVWEEKEGSARGEGEVRYLIPNQIEVNRTEVRRVLTVKYQAYPQKVVDISKVANPRELNTVGGTIQTNGQPVEDVRKIVGTLPPAQMSPDVVKLQEDLIRVTRELAGAGETASGSVSPESASGRAILAVQQAAQAPMTEQKQTYKHFLENLARIWLEYLLAFAQGGAALEEAVDHPRQGQSRVRLQVVTRQVLERLRLTVKIDITPKSPFDRFAQEQTIENLLTQGLFQPQRIGELEAYVSVLDEDSVAPKAKLLEAIRHIRQEQQRIAAIQSQAQLLQQQVRQMLDAEGPLSQLR